MAAPKIVYFIGCWGNYNAPQVGKALMEVMRRNRHDVFVPRQHCCGLPMMANANVRGAEKYFRRAVDALYAAAYPDGIVLTTCPSCNLMLRRQGRAFFDSAEARWLSERVLNAGGYLLQLHREKRLDIDFQMLALRVFYQNPCHLHVQGPLTESIHLLNLLPGIEVTGASDSCCGLGGSYGMKSANFERSQGIARKVWDEARQSGAEAGVTECGGCSMRIQEGTGWRIYHPVELFDMAYRHAEQR